MKRKQWLYLSIVMLMIITAWLVVAIAVSCCSPEIVPFDRPMEEEEIEVKTDIEASRIVETVPEIVEKEINVYIQSLYFGPFGIEPELENYLNWKNTYPDGYTFLVKWGRSFFNHDVTNYPSLQIDPAMYEASVVAAQAWWIDYYLSLYDSPLSGYGMEFMRAGRKYGINPCLLVGLTAAESTFGTDGSLCRTHNNFFGMKGPNKTGIQAVRGWMYWPDIPSAIDGAAYFVSVYWPGAQTAYDLRGYCEGNPAQWIRNVEQVRKDLEEVR